MDHSYEEIRQAAIDILAGREKTGSGSTDYNKFEDSVAEVLSKRDRISEDNQEHRNERYFTLSYFDKDSFMEIFWDLFRQGIITLGCDPSNNEFPNCRLSRYGKEIVENGENLYFYYDVSGYEKVVREQIPDIDDITLLYLKEAMQAFKSGCLLSATVMIGVAAEHTFMKLVETIQQNQNYKDKFTNVYSEKTILRKLNKFVKVLELHQKDIPSEIKEALDTDFMGIMSVIRNFRNESGHPTGKIISREQCYILLNLFIPYCKKLYQLIVFFRDNI